MIFYMYILGMVLHYGFLFAYWQRNWPTIADQTYVDDMVFAAVFAVLWPAVILIALSERENIYKYGLKFW